MLQKLAVPGFLSEAENAREAYSDQMQASKAAVNKWAAAQEMGAGDKLAWRHRPDPIKVLGLFSLQL